MSTATPVSICSNALLMLGDAPISSFDDNSDRARLAANIWPTARDYVLRRHPWNCAIRRQTLNPDAEAPAFDFAYQYTLPGDLLRVLSIGEQGTRVPYRVEGRKILTDARPLLLRYIYRNEDCALWDSALVWGMTQVMRAVFAYGITQSTSLEKLVETVMRDVLQQARATDGQEDEPEALDDNPLMEARYRGVR
jgi:hypothetical protein